MRKHKQSRQGNKPNYTKAQKTSFAQKLRDNPTPAESLLWKHLRAHKMGVKFRRQSLVYGWIADFYCPAAKLVVEVDGRGHDKRKDRFRDKTLNSKGIFTLRFSNEEVLTELQNVLGCIKMLLKLQF